MSEIPTARVALNTVVDELAAAGRSDEAHRIRSIVHGKAYPGRLEESDG